jgi:hypothetical protein
MMEPRDLPGLWRLARAQNRRDGTSYPAPAVFEMDESKPGFGLPLESVALALVTEAMSPGGWRLRQGHVWIRTVEEMSFGGGAVDMEFSAAHIPMAREMLKRRGYLDQHVLVPLKRAEALEPVLRAQGFDRIDLRLAHFFEML